MTLRRTSFFSVLFLASSVSVAGEMLKNPDLEGGVDPTGKAVGWLYKGEKCSVVKGAGRNYSFGLQYKGDGGNYEWLYQNVPIEEGRPYRYQGWFKCRGLTGKGGARLFVACYRANGKWCETIEGEPVTGTSDGWVHLVLDVIPKKGAVKAEICIKVDDGETGTLWADELSFAPMKRPPVKFLVSDTYRDMAADGNVTFRLVSNMSDSEIAGKKWRGVFRLPNPSAVTFFREYPAPAFTNGVSAVTVGVDKMPFGEFPVAFAFKDEKGRTVVSEMMTFTRVRSLPVKGVRINRRGRIHIDGKPFFPLGMFMDGLGKLERRRYAEGPFNCMLAYDMLSREQLDWAHTNGLKVVYCLKNVFRGYCYQPFPMADQAEENAFVTARVAALKDHPALLAWYLADELGVGMVGRLKDRAHLLRRIDPDHPTFSCYCSPEVIQEYMETSDILGTDPYPIGSSRNSSLSRCAKETDTAMTAYFGTRPIWQVTQAFDCTWISKDKTRLYQPTYEELVNMNLQCVAAGANGLLLWEFSWLDRNAHGRSMELFEKNWKTVCKAGALLKGMIPLFLSEDADVPVVGRRPDLPIRVWRHDGRLHVLAVNATRKARKETVHVDGHRLDMSLEPLGYVLEQLIDE